MLFHGDWLCCVVWQLYVMQAFIRLDMVAFVEAIKFPKTQIIQFVCASEYIGAAFFRFDFFFGGLLCTYKWHLFALCAHIFQYFTICNSIKIVYFMRFSCSFSLYLTFALLTFSIKCRWTGGQKWRNRRQKYPSKFIYYSSEISLKQKYCYIPIWIAKCACNAYKLNFYFSLILLNEWIISKNTPKKNERRENENKPWTGDSKQSEKKW